MGGNQHRSGHKHSAAFPGILQFIHFKLVPNILCRQKDGEMGHSVSGDPSGMVFTWQKTLTLQVVTSLTFSGSVVPFLKVKCMQ